MRDTTERRAKGFVLRPSSCLEETIKALHQYPGIQTLGIKEALSAQRIRTLSEGKEDGQKELLDLSTPSPVFPSLHLTCHCSIQQHCCLVWQGLPSGRTTYLSICNGSVPRSKPSRCFPSPASWKLREVAISCWGNHLSVVLQHQASVFLGLKCGFGKGFPELLDQIRSTPLGRRLTSRHASQQFLHF